MVQPDPAMLHPTTAGDPGERSGQQPCMSPSGSRKTTQRTWGRDAEDGHRRAADPARAASALNLDALTKGLTSAVPGAQVATAADAAEQLINEAAPGSAGLTGFFSAFAALSVIVAGLVIVNSFTILVAQRTRELALLRRRSSGVVHPAVGPARRPGDRGSARRSAGDAGTRAARGTRIARHGDDHVTPQWSSQHFLVVGVVQARRGARIPLFGNLVTDAAHGVDQVRLAELTA